MKFVIQVITSPLLGMGRFAVAGFFSLAWLITASAWLAPVGRHALPLRVDGRCGKGAISFAKPLRGVKGDAFGLSGMRMQGGLLGWFAGKFGAGKTGGEERRASLMDTLGARVYGLKA